MTDIKINWTGEFPVLCQGQWELFINGEDYSSRIPFLHSPAGTRKDYTSWHMDKDYMEYTKSYRDGLCISDWIEANKAWLLQLPITREEYLEIYMGFNVFDWRRGCCGGCV